MSNFLESKTTRTVVWIIGGLALLLLAFGAGMAVGYRQGVFASRFGENYYLNFRGGAAGMAGPMMIGAMPGPMHPHGTIGTVISVGTSTIAVQDLDGDEEWVAIGGDTLIRDRDQNVSTSDIGSGDQIAVIGDPNGQGQIMARFIRVFSQNSSSIEQQ